MSASSATGRAFTRRLAPALFPSSQAYPILTSPLDAEVVVRTTEVSAEEGANRVIEYLERTGYLGRPDITDDPPEHIESNPAPTSGDMTGINELPGRPEEGGSGTGTGKRHFR